MIKRNKEGSLTVEEKHIVKALLMKKWRNQDIQDLINRGRKATVNSARITEVKKSKTIQAASDQLLMRFHLKQESWDQKTGLNTFEHERLVRAREAICLAVHVFNSPHLSFKSEVFAVLANIAWTYLIHEYYEQKGTSITDSTGKTLSLGALLDRPDCPVSKNIKNNLVDLKEVRDAVEHKIFERSDGNWISLFQATCINFENTICALFGEKLSLKEELGFALQFSKISVSQISQLSTNDLPEHIAALDAKLKERLSSDELDSTEYKISISYSLESASKSNADVQFITSETDAVKATNVLIKHKPADELYPLKAKSVWEKVSKQTGKKFNSHSHTQAWKRHKVRPAKNSKKPENTNRNYCMYHTAHNDYTYSNDWVDLLVSELNSINP